MKFASVKSESSPLNLEEEIERLDSQIKEFEKITKKTQPKKTQSKKNKKTSQEDPPKKNKNGKKPSEETSDFDPLWARKLIDCIKNNSDIDLPIVQKLKRGSSRRTINFDTYYNIVEDAMVLSETCRHLFGSVREVHRAAHYIGLRMLKTYAFDAKLRSEKGAFLDKLATFMEKIHVSVGIIDCFCDSIWKVNHAFKTGTLGPEQMHENLKKLVLMLPNDLRTLAHMKIKEMLSGARLTDLYEHNPHGGKRSKSISSAMD